MQSQTILKKAFVIYTGCPEHFVEHRVTLPRIVCFSQNYNYNQCTVNNNKKHVTKVDYKL